MANGIGDLDLPEGCENLFDVVDLIQGLGIPPGLGKNVLWEWLKNNECERNHDKALLFFGEIDEGEYCLRQTSDPACV
tara:strand:- start:1410 stop:1643 length:234 start_codon:yes stop_codon:yes gene_type:complete